jgi:hypothetical protein
MTVLYLKLRDTALRWGISHRLYRPVGLVMRRALGLSDTLVQDSEEQRKGEIIASLLAASKAADPSATAAAIDGALDDIELHDLASLLLQGLRGLQSRDSLRLAHFLKVRPEPDLRQVAHILLADRAAFWRDFETAEAEAQASLEESDGKNDEHVGTALNILASAKRRLGKTDEALAVNRMQSARNPLDKKHMADRARIRMLDDPEEMRRLLVLCDAENGRAGQTGNAIYLNDHMERGDYDTVERISLQIESRVPGNRLARAFLANARISRDRDPSVVPAVLRTVGLDSRIDAPDFDRLVVTRPHALPASGPLVSVVVTAYNAEAHLSTAIGSILDQSFREIELIVVDDCSTDRTEEIVRRAEEMDGRVRYMGLRENRGTYMAKNEALRSAKGEYIALCDSDDIWTSDHVAQHVGVMEAGPETVLSTSEWLRLFDDARIDISEDGTIVEVCPHSTFFRREVFDRVGYFDSVRFGADRELVSRISLEYGGEAVRHIPEVLTIGRRHEASLTTSGAGMIGPGQKSDMRLAYWRIWNRWQTETALEKGALFNSGRPDERPYGVPEGMEP